MLGKFWVLWLPLLFLAVQIGCEIIFTRDELVVMMSERGWVEQVQFIVLLLAACVALATIIKMNRAVFSWMGAWVSLALLCCIYVGGEEISWGQHFFNWSTPEYWKDVNDQHETNLHNTTSWLDQKPRLILMLSIGIGGIIFPLLMRFKPGVLPDRFASIYPSPQLMLVSLLVIVPHVLDKIMELMNMNLFHRTSEVQELYMYYFVLLYLVGLYRRIVDKHV